MPARIARYWCLLTASGLAAYLALAVFGAFDHHTGAAMFAAAVGVALAALTVAILLALDEEKPPEADALGRMTYAALAYVLLVKRKSLTALIVLGLASVGIGVYYAARATGVTFENEGSALSVRLPGQTVYYFPVTSQTSWQNTGIRLKKNQTFRYSMTGYVSAGFLQDIDQKSRNLRDFKMKGEPYISPELDWPFTGPEGIDEAHYATLAAQDTTRCQGVEDPRARTDCERSITKHYKHDDGLTVRGVPHNRLVGIILVDGESPDPASGLGTNTSKPGYDYGDPEAKKQLILFHHSTPTAPLNVAPRATTDGVLWVVINDADDYRWDNAGLFFLKVVVP